MVVATRLVGWGVSRHASGSLRKRSFTVEDSSVEHSRHAVGLSFSLFCVTLLALLLFCGVSRPLGVEKTAFCGVLCGVLRRSVCWAASLPDLSGVLPSTTATSSRSPILLRRRPFSREHSFNCWKIEMCRLVKFSNQHPYVQTLYGSDHLEMYKLPKMFMPITIRL